MTMTRTPAAATNHTSSVLQEVAAERVRQHAKWGQQSHPDGTGPDLILRDLPAFQKAVRADHLALWAGRRCKDAPGDGGDTYERILTEEWAEAIAEADPARLRAELVQVAAVAVQWIEAIDRRAACDGLTEAQVDQFAQATCGRTDAHDEHRGITEPIGVNDHA